MVVFRAIYGGAQADGVSITFTVLLIGGQVISNCVEVMVEDRDDRNDGVVANIPIVQTLFL